MQHIKITEASEHKRIIREAYGRGFLAGAVATAIVGLLLIII